MFTLVRGRTALSIAILALAFPVIALAGGLDDDVQLDKFGQKKDILRPPGSTINRPPALSLSAPPDISNDGHNPTMRPPFGSRPTNGEQRGGEERNTGERSEQRNTGERDEQNQQDPSSATDPQANVSERNDQPDAYSKAIEQNIRDNNQRGQPRGNIKLYAKQGDWGAGVRIQACFGDNILTKFTVRDRGASEGLRFEYQGVRNKKSRSTRRGWKSVEPGSLIKGRYIFLRARSSQNSGTITLRVVGICIDDPSDINIPGR